MGRKKKPEIPIGKVKAVLFDDYKKPCKAIVIEKPYFEEMKRFKRINVGKELYWYDTKLGMDLRISPYKRFLKESKNVKKISVKRAFSLIGKKFNPAENSCKIK